MVAYLQNANSANLQKNAQTVQWKNVVAGNLLLIINIMNWSAFFKAGLVFALAASILLAIYSVLDLGGS